MLGNQPHRSGRTIPDRRRLQEVDAYRPGVELLDAPDAGVVADGDRAGGRVSGVLPVEDDVIGAERYAVVPGDVLLELPGGGQPVGRDSAIGATGDLCGQDRYGDAIGVVASQRLVERARAFLILDAGGEVRVEECRPLPQQQAQRTATAALHGLVRRLGRAALGMRDVGQHGRGQRQAHPQRGHAADEVAARQRAVAHLLDQFAKPVFVHGCPCGLKGRVGRSRVTVDSLPGTARASLPAHLALKVCERLYAAEQTKAVPRLCWPAPKALLNGVADGDVKGLLSATTGRSSTTGLE